MGETGCVREEEEEGDQFFLTDASISGCYVDNAPSQSTGGRRRSMEQEEGVTVDLILYYTTKRETK